MGKGGAPVYIIGKQTKAIMRKDATYYRTQILEEGRKRHSSYTLEYILDQSCKAFASSLKGRKDAVKEILNSASKLPIPIDTDSNIYMMPTTSLKNKDCVFLAFHQIKFYVERDDKTFIGFHDGSGIYVNASYNTVDMQHKRASQLILYFNRSNIFGEGIWT
ncbi:competence protein ComK [Virgibacillus sp. NKC19-16]|uniref:competence protein ComK n=1 Tax=Virgibacillus salidurans TaxID=2831673 RepID=UPI001F4644ED|nr:competence protein ComK [Virgibacillus sp. NKC19-16]UJL45955.1 competence protein ComK [Virgibacillus sp. NKC19-16]